MDSPPFFTTGSSELLSRVEPLWEQLRAHHADASIRFGDQLRGISFASRQSQLLAKSTGGLHVVLACAGERDVGYCVCTIGPDGSGEIDSLFVESSLRRQRLGERLVRSALAWFASKSVTRISVEVLVGNEAALPFYARLGFFPRTHRLALVADAGGD